MKTLIASLSLILSLSIQAEEVCSKYFHTLDIKVGHELGYAFVDGELDTMKKLFRDHKITPQTVLGKYDVCETPMHYILSAQKYDDPINGTFGPKHKEILKWLISQGHTFNMRTKLTPNSAEPAESMPAIALIGGWRDASLVKIVLELGGNIYDVWQDAGWWETIMFQIVRDDVRYQPHTTPTVMYLLDEKNYPIMEGGVCAAFSTSGYTVDHDWAARDRITDMAIERGYDRSKCRTDPPVPGSFDFFHVP